MWAGTDILFRFFSLFVFFKLDYKYFMTACTLLEVRNLRLGIIVVYFIIHFEGGWYKYRTLWSYKTNKPSSEFKVKLWKSENLFCLQLSRIFFFSKSVNRLHFLSFSEKDAILRWLMRLKWDSAGQQVAEHQSCDFKSDWQTHSLVFMASTPWRQIHEQS